MKSISIFRLILANSFRRGARTCLLSLGVALMVGAVFAAQVIESGVTLGLRQGMQRLGADLLIVPRGQAEEAVSSMIKGQKAPELTTLDLELMEKVRQMPGVVEVTSQLFLQSLSGASCCSAWAVFLIAFEPQTDFVVRPWLEAHPGRALKPDEVLVGDKITFEVGDTLKFYGHNYTIAGKLEPSGLGLDLTVFIPYADARVMIAQSAQMAEKTLEVDTDRVSAIMARLVPQNQGGSKPYKIAYEIERFYPDVSVIHQDAIQQMTRQNIQGTVHLLRYAGWSAWLVSVLWIGMVFMMSSNERRREIGLLRALGASRGNIAWLMLGEGVLVFSLGGLLGLLVSGGVLYGFMGLIISELEVPFLWPAWHSIVGMACGKLLLSTLTGLVAALIPSLRVSLLEPYQAVRTGEL